MSAPHTMRDLAKACDREAAMRRRVYPRWVADRRMNPATADKEIALMEAAAAHFRELAAAEEVKGRLL